MSRKDILSRLKTACQKTGKEYVLPNEEKCIDLSGILLVIIGDNPGQKELEEKKYFVGSQTECIRVLFQKIFGEKYREKVLFLNKTPIFSNITNSLKKSENINNTQEIMAELVRSIAEEKKIPIWVMGVSQLNNLFKTFYERIKDIEEVAVFYHPSRGWFLRTDLKDALKKTKLTKKEFEQISFSPDNAKTLLRELEKIGKERKDKLYKVSKNL